MLNHYLTARSTRTSKLSAFCRLLSFAFQDYLIPLHLPMATNTHGEVSYYA